MTDCEQASTVSYPIHLLYALLHSQYRKKPHISATGRRPGLDSPWAALGILVYSDSTILMSEEWLLLEFILWFLCGIES